MEEFSFLRISRDSFAFASGPFEAFPASMYEASMGPGFIVSEFDPAKEPLFLRPRSFELLGNDELLDRLPSRDAEKSLQIEWKAPEQQAYRSTFQRLQSELSSGQLQKAVPVVSERAEVDFSEDHLGHIATRLMESDPGLYQYGFWFRSEGLFGVSPEILFRLEADKRRVTTVALAASRPPELEHELLEDFKEVREQRLVRDFLVEKLEAYGSVKEYPPEILSLRQVSHIRQRIECQSRTDVRWQRLVQMLHPTPALGVYPPKSLTPRLLEQMDPSGERRRHGAPFGAVLPSGEVHIIVAIRNVQVLEKQMRIFAGGGLLRESDFDAEWAELAMKISAVKSALRI